ncbi:MAG: hypothetical protein KF699_06320 [Phycisphaeraceae bacterium]|nr:hypothetical protein [Phycisphaeraceae bacterium]
MQLRICSVLCLFALAMLVVAQPASARPDRGRGSDDTRNDDRRPAAATSGSSSGQASQNNVQELRFVARMRDGDGTVARARYQERNRNGRAQRQRFDIEIKFAQPGEQFEVRADGRLVGTITADGLGTGKLELRPTPDNPNEAPIPADFPKLRAGAVITVGSMSGTLVRQ